MRRAACAPEFRRTPKLVRLKAADFKLLSRV